MERIHPWERLIEIYFEIGLKYKDIKSVLASEHGFHVSERHLKRLLNARGHFRRKTFCDVAVLIEFISNQIQYSGQLHGYRWMFAKCREHGLRMRKEEVHLVLKEPCLLASIDLMSLYFTEAHCIQWIKKLDTFRQLDNYEKRSRSYEIRKGATLATASLRNT
ncbi:hypothetical protein ABVT39_002719 [Epinephelus coioides]